MFGIELQFVSNGRRFSLDEVADLVAGKVAQLVAMELKERLMMQPPQTVRHDTPKVVSIPEAAKLLALSRSTVWQYIKQKRIEVVRLGPRTTRIRMDAINEMVRDGIPEPVRARNKN